MPCKGDHDLTLLDVPRVRAPLAAEACSKTATKLVEMARLLEQLAFDKVQQGDEAGAKDALREKTSVTEAIEKNSDKVPCSFPVHTVSCTLLTYQALFSLHALHRMTVRSLYNQALLCFVFYGMQIKDKVCRHPCDHC